MRPDARGSPGSSGDAQAAKAAFIFGHLQHRSLIGGLSRAQGYLDRLLEVFFPSGQKRRLSSSGPALFEGSEQGLALVMKTKAGELLALSDGGLSSQFPPADTVKPSGALLQVLLVGRILLPPSRIGHTAAVAQQIGVPVLATTHAAILRLEPA